MSVMHPARSFRQHSIIPGFGLTFGMTLAYLGLIVLIPLAVMFAQASSAGAPKIWAE
jgi:sulfate transport system permease protein